MKTSIIISTYNSPEWLQKVLWGFSNQSRSNFEILIADDGSSGDNLKQNKEIIASSDLDIEHVWQEDDGFQKCKILNKAISKSDGDYLIFTDGDCIPHPEFVAAHLANADQNAFLSGGYSKLPMALSQHINQCHIDSGDCFRPSWLLENGLKISSSWLKMSAKSWKLDTVLNTVTRAKRTFNGNNASCFKESALAVNGFDERLHYGGEDREFGYRLENVGIKAKGMRYSAPCLHLDHPRGYVDEALRKTNKQIIDKTRNEKITKTEFGINR